MDAACILVFTVSTGYKNECSINPATDPAMAALQRRLLSNDSASNSNRGKKEPMVLGLDDGLLFIPDVNGEKDASLGTDTAVDADAVDPITS